jgi:hypothetical protein
MNITEVYNGIVERLNKSGHSEVVKDLDDLLGSATTGSEALGLAGKYLSDLKESKSLIYKSIKDLVIEYIKYCKKNGIIIE